MCGDALPVKHYNQTTYNEVTRTKKEGMKRRDISVSNFTNLLYKAKINRENTFEEHRVDLRVIRRDCD